MYLLTGLISHNRYIAIVFYIFICSICGLPPLIGFFGKYYTIMLCIYNSYYILANIAIITSIIGSYYYINLIRYTVFNTSGIKYKNTLLFNSTYSALFSGILSIITLAILIFFIYSDYVLYYINIMYYVYFLYLISSLTFLVYLIFIFVLITVLLVVNKLFSIFVNDSQKVTYYECGFKSYYIVNWSPIAIIYGVVAIIFMVFDIEILFVYPFISSIIYVSIYGYYIFLILL